MVVVPGEFSLRRATLADVSGIAALISTSARALSPEYSGAQVEGALRGAFGVDTQLIRDGSYFVIEAQGTLAGCGGWSRRRTLFGSDARADRDATELDPRNDAARIRAFFVHPDFARHGLGTRLLEQCERDATAHGFSRFELMATLPGVHLYAARGYESDAPVDWPLNDGVTIRFVPMRKRVSVASIHVEPASVDDAPEILALQKLAFQSEARLYDDWNIPPLVQSLDSLRAEFGSSRVLKAVEGGHIVGSVRARAQDGTCHVIRLVVAPDRQGRGIGTRLMRDVEAQFPDVLRFELFTGHLSEGNLRLYERLGYRRCREHAVTPAVTLVFLEKSR
jgi:GNAT superfamily N-acetyltransferase